MKTVLFLCTGNYYRSRYAEILFNWKTKDANLGWRADSRGLRPSPANPGPLSRHTIAALEALGIPHDSHLRYPLPVTNADFQSTHHVVAVKEAEHRPLMQSLFPAWLNHVEFWHVHDLDCCVPEDTIPHLDREIDALIARLASSPAQTRRSNCA